MGPEPHGRNIRCVLCKSSKENLTTGPLSTKDSVTAHQNCLLYSSGVICQNSPEFDDLFGFTVKDVQNEMRRGNRLICYRCKRKGATVGCEVKRCQKSYHYPCAVEDGAHNVEDRIEGKYTVYCQKHNPELASNGTSLSCNGDSDTEKNNNGEMSSKLFCVICEKKEESVSLEHIDSGIFKLYCEKHKPLSLQKELNGPSSCKSDYNTPENQRQTQTPKRLLNSSSKREVTSSRKSKHRRIMDNSSDSDGDVNRIDMEFSPLESNLEDLVNSEHSNHAETPIASTTGNQPAPEDGDCTLIDSDAGSQSLLLPVMLCVASEEPSQATVCSSESCQGFVPHSPGSPHGCSHSPGPAIDPILPVHSPDCSSVHSGPLNLASTAIVCYGPVSSPPSPSTPSPHAVSQCPLARPGGPGSPGGSGSGNAASRVFWRRCTEAGCTESIFTTFISDMVGISKRILSDQASQEDYDLSLRVIEASGKLSQMLSQQEREFKKKQRELQRATAAIREARSALKR
ncbi:PHD finger protein 7 isoform X2 [Oncorhynchus tshawytscha]|uniref:PHD finger protein 7 isoform X2 n=1 Tax=Oncorhynchus tshawytscha TaxID=74940 RepID=UPI000D09F5AE|nr:PHD finger protein 7 isoform X2 [Oncorhynchus tshawytscha]